LPLAVFPFRETVIVVPGSAIPHTLIFCPLWKTIWSEKNEGNLSWASEKEATKRRTMEKINNILIQRISLASFLERFCYKIAYDKNPSKNFLKVEKNVEEIYNMKI
jgi:hypothetical protein